MSESYFNIMKLKINKESLRKACLRNAEDLLEESKLLFSKQKYSRATTLAITSFEEALKAGLVSALINGLVIEKLFKKIWFKHEQKYLLKYARFIAKVYSDGESNLGLYIPSNRKEEIKQIFDIRNKSLYVDYSNNKIEIPKKSIRVHQALKYIKIAQRQIEDEKMIESLKSRLKRALVIK